MLYFHSLGDPPEAETPTMVSGFGEHDRVQQSMKLSRVTMLGRRSGKRMQCVARGCVPQRAGKMRFHLREAGRLFNEHDSRLVRANR